jgi:hypothetical protein
MERRTSYNEKGAGMEKTSSDIPVTVRPLSDDLSDEDEVENIIRAEHEFNPEEYRKLLWKIDLCVRVRVYSHD